MNVKTRHVLAVAMLATALCADRAIGAPQQQQARAQAVEGSQTLLTRISVGFRRVVATTRLNVSLHQLSGSSETRVEGPTRTAKVRVAQTSPFQFRLPPPAC